MIAWWLVVVGAINWGLYGLLGMDLVATFLGGPSSLLSKIVYVIIGLAGVWLVWYQIGGKKNK